MQSDPEAITQEAAQFVLGNRIDKRMERFRSFRPSVDLSGSTARFPFLTGYLLEVREDGKVDWNPSFPNQERSNQMWLYSLTTVGQLCTINDPCSAEFSWARRIVISFLDASRSSEFISKLEKIPSADHSGATRVNALIAYVQNLRLATDVDLHHVADVVGQIKRWCDWLCEDHQFSKNNHGVMVAMALLQGAKQLEGIPGSEKYVSVAEGRLQQIVEEAFDEDGMCNENTIGYHNFNMKLYQQIVDFLAEHFPNSSLRKFLKSTLQRAESALALSIRPDGSIPPIGDSPEYLVKTTSINEPYSFAESGFSVIKDDDLYVSFVCGARTEIHKHQDDTSITVRYKGRDILIDGGSYNYDRTDPYRQCVQSSYGHSGVFPSSIEGLSRREVSRRHGGHRDRTTQFFTMPKYVGVAGTTASLDGTRIVERQVAVFWPNEIVIVDAAIHDTSADSPGWVARFLFGDEQIVKRVDETKFTFSDGFVGGTLFQLSKTDHEIYRGVSEHPYRGWRSRSNGKILPTTGLDFHIRSRAARFTTLLKLDNVDASLEDFSENALNFAIGAFSPFE